MSARRDIRLRKFSHTLTSRPHWSHTNKSPNRWGIFRLTNPPGLPHILQCQRSETFHQHSIDSTQLYTEAGHPPGHVYESKTMEFEVCDLRPEKQ